MKTPGELQRSYLRKNKQKKSIQGYFYIKGKRHLKTLCSFEKAGLNPKGELVRKTKPNEAKYIKRLHSLYHKKELELSRTAKPVQKDLTTFKEIAERWISISYSNRSKAKSTIEKIYRPMIRLYLQFVKNHPLTDISIHHVDEFKKGLAKKNLSRETTNLHVRTLRTFCNWARKRGHLEKLPEFEMIPTIKRLPNVYTDEEVKKLFTRIRHLASTIDDKRQARYYAIHERFLFTAVGTGFRRSEILFLEWDQFDLEKGFVILKSKEEFNFRVKENQDTIRLVLPFTVEYLRKIRQANPGERYLLDDGKGNLIYKDQQSISMAFRRHKNELGLNPKVKSIHGFRALFASMAEESGIDIRMIQLLLNHSDPKVTSIYLRRPDQMMQMAMKKIDKRMKRIGFAA